MSFLAKLNLDGEEFVVLDCEYGITQGSNENGLPSNKIRGGKIRLLIESTIKVDFLEWAITNNATKNGEITFFKRDNVSSFKTLEFREAFCLELFEKFNSEDGQPLQTSLLISAKEITIRGTTLTNNWPVRGMN